MYIKLSVQGGTASINSSMKKICYLDYLLLKKTENLNGYLNATYLYHNIIYKKIYTIVLA